MGIPEAAASGVPVISTNVGCKSRLKELKTFETVEEAVELIKSLNENPQNLSNYTRKLQLEVLKEFSWKVLAPLHWTPFIKTKISDQTKHEGLVKRA